VHAAKVGKTELTLSLPRTAAYVEIFGTSMLGHPILNAALHYSLGMRLRSIAPKGLISRVHQCLMVRLTQTKLTSRCRRRNTPCYNVQSHAKR